MTLYAFLHRPRRSALAVLTQVTLLTYAAHVCAADTVADAFGHLSDARLVSRSVSLTDLGIREPLVLSAPDARHELYVPVPAGVPIDDATLALDSTYLRADGGRTTMLVSLDGTPVNARSFTQGQGNAGASIGVDGAARPGGFVRVGVQWSSVLDDRLCTDQTAIGNVLRIAPSSHLTYRFDPAAITDVRTAWSALPVAPVVAIAGRHLGAPAFDTAWRTETMLEREGHRPVTHAWPAVGDTVDTTGLNVPQALRSIPAFAALATGSTVTLADPAQVGALLVLAPRSAFAPDIIVADDALRRAATDALNALRTQIVAHSAGGTAAFDAWRSRAWNPIEQPLAAGEIRIAKLPGQTALVVGDPTGAEALARTWRPIGVANRYVVHFLDETPDAHADRVTLAALGGTSRTFDVFNRATWDASFDLAAITASGKLPDTVVLDVAAAPAPAPALHGDGAIASLEFNGVLIASQLLKQDGRPERIVARIPRYALAPVNTLRVVFQRRPDGGCATRTRGYPVAVLPTSHITLVKAQPDDDFTGMLARFATGTDVVVPAAYLNDATASVPRLAQLANLTGVVPTRATLTVASAEQTATPTGPFLAADVALHDETGAVTLSKDRLTLKDASGDVLADVSGLSRLAVIQVAHAGSISGIVYRELGDAAQPLPATLDLTHGDVAFVPAHGAARIFNTRHPGEMTNAAATRNRWLSWWIAAGALAALLALFVAAGIARRRHRAKDGE